MKIINIPIIFLLLILSLQIPSYSEDVNQIPPYFNIELKCDGKYKYHDETIENRLYCNDNSEIIYEDKVLFHDSRFSNIHSAVYHDQDSILTFATASAEVYCFDLTDTNPVELGRFIPKFKAKIRKARYTLIPGLMYLLCDDLKHVKFLKQAPLSQTYSDRYFRVVLLETAEKYQGITKNYRHECFLKAYYCFNKKDIVITDYLGNKTDVKLHDYLSEPYRSGPGDSLAQSVYIFPDNGILCKTDYGWSLNNPDGRFKGRYSEQGVKVGWWGEPFCENGNFYVRTHNMSEVDEIQLEVKENRSFEYYLNYGKKK